MVPRVLRVRHRVFDVQLSDRVETLGWYGWGEHIQQSRLGETECMARVQQVDAFRVDLPAGQEQGEPVPVRRQFQAVAVPAVAVAAAGLHVCVCGVPLVAE